MDKKREFAEAKIKRDEQGRFARKQALQVLAVQAAAKSEKKASSLTVERDPAKIERAMQAWSDHFDSAFAPAMQFAFEKNRATSMRAGLDNLERIKGDDVDVRFLVLPDSRKQSLDRFIPKRIAAKILEEEIAKSNARADGLKDKVKGLGIREDDVDRLIDSQSIIEHMADRFRFGGKADKANMAAVFDDNGNMQAAAAFSLEKGHLYVSFLATAPWNISGNDSRRTKGAGSKMIAEAVKISREKGRKGALKLQPLNKELVPFYEKAGFKMMKGSGHMVLSAQEAEKRYG